MSTPIWGKFSPLALLVHNGKYYPYKFGYLTKAEADALPDDGDYGFSRYYAFLEDFADVVERENIAGIIALKLLTAEEKVKMANPNTEDYEVNEDGGAMIALSSDQQLNNIDGAPPTGWMFTSGVPTARMIYHHSGGERSHGVIPTPDSPPPSK